MFVYVYCCNQLEHMQGTLERDMRAVQLVLPAARDIVTVKDAEVELNRVLGAVERYAADLPEVIRHGLVHCYNFQSLVMTSFVC